MTEHIYAHEHPESEHRREGGFTLWFTGLSGAGKSTIAHLVELRPDQVRDRRLSRTRQPGEPEREPALTAVLRLRMIVRIDVFRHAVLST